VAVRESGEKSNVLGETEKTLRTVVESWGFSAFHGSQIFNWVYHKYCKDFQEMTDLPKNLRKNLEEKYFIGYPHVQKTIVSKNKDAKKYSLLYGGDVAVEAVVLSGGGERISFCISSQVGCTAGCLYCATGMMGFIRNLTSGEIVGQVLTLMESHGQPNSVLFMGMGEPLFNFASVVSALRLLNSIGIGVRKIVISTCGVTSRIHDLAKSDLHPRLAVSIGSAIEETRKKIIPVAKNNPLQDVKKAVVFYRKHTGKRVSLEYTLMRGVNDSIAEASALAQFARETGCHVNLIRFNRVEGKALSPPRTKTVSIFREALERRGIAVSERYRKGQDISAACGQLACCVSKGTQTDKTCSSFFRPEEKTLDSERGILL
jgi:23S rRNA (adenine2503-C2)-methyltransferase